jgi:hypothetical protein
MVRGRGTDVVLLLLLVLLSLLLLLLLLLLLSLATVVVSSLSALGPCVCMYVYTSHVCMHLNVLTHYAQRQAVRSTSLVADIIRYPNRP